MLVTPTSFAGVPAFVTEDDGPVRAALAFRVGTSDERLVDAGVTHLVEHLAMHALGRTAHDSNAFVDALRTVFYATGTVEEVSAFLRDVCGALRALPLDRLELERRVLLTEAARRGGGAHDELLAYRFGPRSYGVRAYGEPGLRRLQVDDVAAWTAARFTRGNAALWATVPLDDLELDLPDGPRLDAVEPHSIDVLPARFAGRTALGLDVVAPRSLALSTGWRVLRHRLHDALRREHAVVYDVGIDAERVGRDGRRFVLLTDPLPEVRYRAGQLLTRSLEQVLQDGVTDEEVAAESALAARAYVEPGAGLGAADAATLDALVGLPFTDPARYRDEQAALTGADVTAALREALQGALVAVPNEVVTVLPLDPVARWSTTTEPGRAFLPDPRVATTAAAAQRRLVVGDTATAVWESELEAVSVAYRSCQAVLAWEDGSRRLFGADGFNVTVLPWEWQDGAGAVELLDRSVPAELVVPMGPGDGPPAALAQPPAAPAPPRRAVRTWLLLVLWLSLSLPFTVVAFTPVALMGDSGAGPYVGVGCDRASAVRVLRDGPGPGVSSLPSPGREQLADACEEAAVNGVVASLFGGMSSAAAVFVMGLRTRSALQRRRGTRQQVLTPDEA